MPDAWADVPPAGLKMLAEADYAPYLAHSP